MTITDMIRELEAIRPRVISIHQAVGPHVKEDISDPWDAARLARGALAGTISATDKALKYLRAMEREERDETDTAL